MQFYVHHCISFYVISAVNVGNYLQHSKIETINSTERTNIQVEAVIHAQSP